MKIRIGAVVSLTLLVAACGSLNPTRTGEMTDPDATAEKLTQAWSTAVAADRSPDPEQKKGESLRMTQLRILQDAEAAALEHPRHVPILMLCAALSHELDRTMDAQAYLASLFEVDPTNPDAAVLRGRIAIEEGNYVYAIRFLEEQARIHPDHAGLPETRAAALFLAKRFFEARADLHTAELLGAPAWRIAYNRGLIAEEEGMFEAALDLYSSCLEARPDFAPARERTEGIHAKHLPRFNIPPK